MFPETVLERAVGVATEKVVAKESRVKRGTARTGRRLVRNATKAAKVPDEDFD